MSIDSWYAAANQPHAAAAVDRRDRQTEGWRWNCKSGQHINLYLPRNGSSTKTQQCASINIIKTKTTTKSVINKWHFVLMHQHNILNNQLYSPFTKLVATMQEWTTAEDIARTLQKWTTTKEIAGVDIAVSSVIVHYCNVNHRFFHPPSCDFSQSGRTRDCSTDQGWI